MILLLATIVAEFAVLLWLHRPRSTAKAQSTKAPEWDPDVRDCRIASALREQLEYEAGHADRQRARGGHLPAPVMHAHHGPYDSDQRAHSVLLKVRRVYDLAGEQHPPGLAETIREVLK